MLRMLIDRSSVCALCHRGTVVVSVLLLICWSYSLAEEDSGREVEHGRLGTYSRGGNYFAFITGDNELRVRRFAKVESISAEKIAELFAQLDSEHFHTRNQAFTELKRLGPTIAGQLAQQSAKTNSLEVDERLKALKRAIAVSARSTSAQRVRDLTFSPDEEFIAAGGSDRTVTIWRTESQQVERIISSIGSTIHSLAFSPDSQWLAIGTGNGEILLYDVRRQTIQETLLGHRAAVTDLQFSTNQSRLFSGGGSDQRIGIWKTDDLNDATKADQRHVAWLEGHTDTVTCVNVSLDDRFLVSGGYDRDVLVWDVRRRQLSRRLKGHTGTVRSIEFLSDHFITAGDDGLVMLWNSSVSSPIAKLDPRIDSVHRVSIRPHSTWIAISGSSNRLVSLPWTALTPYIR